MENHPTSTKRPESPLHDAHAVLTGSGDHHAHDSGGHHVPTNYAPSTRRGVVVFVVALVAVLAFIFLRGHHERKRAAAELEGEVRHSAAEPTAIDVVRLAAAPADTVLTLPGEARAFYETTIFARTNGYVSKWLVDIGDHVKEGQVLATIETPELDDQLTAAKAKMEELKSEVHVAETAASFAKVSFDRWQALAPEGAVSQQERDQKEAELSSSKAKLEAAKAQVTLGQADVQRLTTLTGFKKVAAPFAGVITQRHVDIGALVTAGSTSNTSPLFSIAQSDQIRVFVDVPQAAVPYMKVGNPVTATAHEYAGRVFHGKVDRTASAVDPVSRTLRVQVLVPNADQTLLPGMYVQVSFQNTRATPPVRVPAGAVCFRPTGPAVAVVGPDHRVMFHDINISRDMGDYVEVDRGVKADEQVALNVGNDVNDGDAVDPHLLDLTTPATAPPGAKPQGTAETNPEAPARPVVEANLVHPANH